MRRVILILALITVFILIMVIPEVPNVIEKADQVGIEEFRPPNVSENLSESYPEYPTLEDCMYTKKWRFCIADVAELTNDISLCHRIKTPDIRFFCIAKISLNETLCTMIGEEGLRDACTESVNMKIHPLSED